MYPFRPSSLIDGGIALVLVISKSGVRRDRTIVLLKGMCHRFARRNNTVRFSGGRFQEDDVWYAEDLGLTKTHLSSCFNVPGHHRSRHPRHIHCLDHSQVCTSPDDLDFYTPSAVL
jgi:hypothetical protein